MLYSEKLLNKTCCIDTVGLLLKITNVMNYSPLHFYKKFTHFFMSSLVTLCLLLMHY